MTPQYNVVNSVGGLIARSNERDEGPEELLTLNWRLLFGGFLVGIGYYFGAKLGFALTLHPRPVSVMWPPNSILLAALLLTPVRSWWFLLVCAATAHFAVQLQSNVPLVMVICWLVSNCTEALLGAGFIYLIAGRRFRLDGLANTSAFLLCGVFFGPFLSSFLDTAFVRWNQWGQGAYWEIWRIRFFANVLASLTIVPLILAWARADYRKLRRANWKHCIEATLLASGLLLVGFKIFVGYESGPKAEPALLYAPLPFLLWAAIRFGGQGATAATFVIALISIGGAAHARGPFSTQSSEANALSLQLFLSVASVLLLLLSAVMGDRDRAQERFAKAFHSSPDAIIIIRQKNGNIVESNERAEALLGFGRAEALGRTAFDLNSYFCDADLVKWIACTSGRTSLQNLELPFRTKSGELRRALFSAETEEIEGELCLIVVVRDITERRLAEEEAREVSGKLITAQEDERKRIARDLHDDLNQRLAMLSVEMEIICQESEHMKGPVHQHLEAIGLQVKELSSEVHRLSYQLHPAKLDQLGLVVAARTFCRELASQTETAIHFEHAGVPRDVDADIALCLYRVIQEAVQNSIRHNGGAAIQVGLHCAAERIRLLITDRGKGFDVDLAIHNGGLGLVSMRERVRQVNGTIQFISSPGNGTRIEATVPLLRQALV